MKIENMVVLFDLFSISLCGYAWKIMVKSMTAIVSHRLTHLSFCKNKQDL